MSYIRETCSAEITRSPTDCALFGWLWIEVDLGQFWPRQKLGGCFPDSSLCMGLRPCMKEADFGPLPFFLYKIIYRRQSAAWSYLPKPCLSHAFEHEPQLTSQTGGKWFKVSCPKNPGIWSPLKPLGAGWVLDTSTGRVSVSSACLGILRHIPWPFYLRLLVTPCSGGCWEDKMLLTDLSSPDMAS